MDTTINNTAASTATPNRNHEAAKAPPVDTETTTPEKTEDSRAVQASGRSGKPVFQRMTPNSPLTTYPLTTYRDQDSGRLVVRVYDRKHGDILIEFPPEKAFRSLEEVLRGVGKNPKYVAKV